MSARDQIMLKINNYFDNIDAALDIKDYSTAQIYMAKLSKYFHIFDDELSDYYNYLVDALDGVGSPVELIEDDYYEPTELDEWHDFDQDC